MIAVIVSRINTASLNGLGLQSTFTSLYIYYIYKKKMNSLFFIYIATNEGPTIK